MKPVIISQEAILDTCRKLVTTEGLPAINMRSVAKTCGVAVGSLYNYFPSKDALLQATVRSVWMDIFSGSGDTMACKSFLEYLQWMFARMQWACTQYPGFLTLHAVSFTEKSRMQGRQEMEQYFAHLKAGMLSILENDPNVRPDAFGETLSRGELVDLSFSTLVWLFLQGKSSCDAFFEMIRRAIY